MRLARTRAAGGSRPPRWLAAALLAWLGLAGGCSSCPPAWAEALEVDDRFIWASSSAGPVYVDADATRLALTRAARRLAEHLGLDVERRLSVVLVDGALYVEAVGWDGSHHQLDGLELMDLVDCDGRVHARVRLDHEVAALGDASPDAAPEAAPEAAPDAPPEAAPDAPASTDTGATPSGS